MTYQIAIPSHARSEAINRATLRYLAEEGIDKDRIRVFVAPEQLNDYRANLDPGLFCELVEGASGVRGNHNAITNYYPDGIELVRFDDDVRYLAHRVSEKKLERLNGLDLTINYAFEQTAAAGATMWGVYPVNNPFFMKPKVRIGLSFIIGQCVGQVNHHDEILEAEVKIDYERTLQRFIKDGAVVRFDFLTAVAGGVRGNKGGLQSLDRQAMNERATKLLLEKYPNYVALRKPRADGYQEIRLVNG